jgi:threonine/homoserine/homoserine lactone efflux protein
VIVDLAYLLRGMWIGLAIAIPVGPIGLLCIQRTLAYGRLVGFTSGLGAATADMLYGLVAALGLSVITDVLVARADWVRVAGAVFLAFLGVRTFLARPAAVATPTTSRGLLGAWASTFGLTLANPLTIVSFIGIFAALAISKVGEGRSSAAGASPVSVTYALGVLIIRVLRLVDQTGRLAVRNTISR